VLGVTSSSSLAVASSIWDRAVDPTLADLDYAHRFAAEKELEAEELDQVADATARVASPSDDDLFQRGKAILARQAARSILERYGAATSSDVRLRFDLGHILARLQECAPARDVLLDAVKIAPNDARASSAWFDVAICDAHLGKRDEEAKAYVEALALADDADERALLFGNLAEARMSLGDLEGARAAAESAIELSPDLVLIRWSLAVILDRSGDTFAALEQVNVAIAADPLFLHLHDPGVFFEPPYEVHWYEGLGELATAKKLAPKSADWELHLFAALHDFTQYLDAAPKSDRWRNGAEEHVRFVELTLNLKKK